MWFALCIPWVCIFGFKQPQIVVPSTDAGPTDMEVDCVLLYGWITVYFY